eukprot:gene7657-biopygen6092
MHRRALLLAAVVAAPSHCTPCEPRAKKSLMFPKPRTAAGGKEEVAV